MKQTQLEAYLISERMYQFCKAIQFHDGEKRYSDIVQLLWHEVPPEQKEWLAHIESVELEAKWESLGIKFEGLPSA